MPFLVRLELNDPARPKNMRFRGIANELQFSITSPIRNPKYCLPTPSFSENKNTLAFEKDPTHSFLSKGVIVFLILMTGLKCRPLLCSRTYPFRKIDADG